MFRRPDQFDILDSSAEAIDQDTPGTGCAGKPLLIRQLDPLLTGSIDIGKPDHVRSRIPCRVITPIFGMQKDARQVELINSGCDIGRQLTFEVDELAFLVGQATLEGSRRDIEHPRQLLALASGQVSQLRRSPHRLGWRAKREHITIAIGNSAPVCDHLNRSMVAGLTASLEEVLVQAL